LRAVTGSAEIRRLEQFLARSVERVPDAIALVGGEQRIDYRELGRRVSQLAWSLRRRGVATGDRVALFASNTIDAAIAFWAILRAGAVAVPINPQTRSEKLTWVLQHCGATALVTESRLAPVFASALERLPGIATIVTDDHTDGHGDALAEPEPPPPVDGDGSELAALIYTSGSTGRPKGVMLSHHNMIRAADSICRYLEIAESDVVHGIMPMAFDYGLYQLVMAVRQGARLVLAPPFLLPAQVLKQAAAERVTFFPGVPTVFAMLGELRDLSAWDLSNVRAVTSTAAALTERHIEVIRRVFPRARIFSMYGITECKRCTYLPPEDLERKPGSVGIAIPDTELWLVDEHDRRVGPGEIGQLVIRGPHVMQGYWGDPQETARLLRPGPRPGERVLYTGDLCRLDAEGYLYFVARTDDIIKSRGEKVAPKEVEAVLSAVPGVLEAAVIGVADPLLGQAVVAFVVPAAGATLVEAELLRACRDQLEAFMVPRSIRIVPALAKNANGKIDKLSLRRPEAPCAP
jgi:amino acid adenylation domain-containing protein